MSENNNDSKPKRRFCWLALGSFLCAIAAVLPFVIILAYKYFEYSTPDYISSYIPNLGWVAAPLGIILGIWAYWAIKTSKETMKGKLLAVTGSILSAFILVIFLFPSLTMTTAGTSWARCGSNLSGLGKAMLVYGSDNNDMFPTAENWCDLLVMYADITPRQFVCKRSDVRVGESSYALNSNVGGRNMEELDGDIVLAFETGFGSSSEMVPLESRGFNKYFLANGRSTFGNGKSMVAKDRWNQAGGAEMITIDNHKGCNVLFIDGRVEFVRRRDLSKLNWGSEPDESEPIIDLIEAETGSGDYYK